MIGLTQAEFSDAQNSYDWGDRALVCSVQMPPMVRADAEEWISKLLLARGGSILFRPPGNSAPRGAAGGSPAVDGSHSGAVRSLATVGFTASVEALKAGDWFSIHSNYLGSARAFDNGVWSKAECTVSANSQTAPDGSSTADRITPAAFATNVEIAQTVTIADMAGKVMKAAVWLKAPTPFTTVLQITNQGFAQRASQAISITTSWQRFSVDATMASGDTAALFYIGGTNSWIEADGPADVWLASLWSEELTGSLKKNLSAATPDSNRKVTLAINPQTRAIVTDGSAIVTSSPKGLFRLIGAREWDIDEAIHYGLSFELMELF